MVVLSVQSPMDTKTHRIETMLESMLRVSVAQKLPPERVVLLELLSGRDFSVHLLSFCVDLTHCISLINSQDNIIAGERTVLTQPRKWKQHTDSPEQEKAPYHTDDKCEVVESLPILVLSSLVGIHGGD